MVHTQAYRRRWKFYKIYQMLEKLALLGITLYTPQTSFDSSKTWKRLAYATAVAGFGLALSVFSHAFQDTLEAGLDVTSRFANLANCGVALIMAVGLHFPAYAINICMIGANGINVLMFIVCLTVGPIR